MNIEQYPAGLRALLHVLHVDFRPLRQPSGLEVIVASLVAVASSLTADYLLIKLGTRVFSSTRGYVHFQFSDYAKLTIVGVTIACAAWPIVTRLTSTPRRLFVRAALIVTVVLLAPDAYIWHQGSSAKAVAVLVWMHLAIAFITYNSLVRLAPVRRARHAR